MDEKVLATQMDRFHGLRAKGKGGKGNEKEGHCRNDLRPGIGASGIRGFSRKGHRDSGSFRCRRGERHGSKGPCGGAQATAQTRGRGHEHARRGCHQRDASRGSAASRRLHGPRCDDLPPHRCCQAQDKGEHLDRFRSPLQNPTGYFVCDRIWDLSVQDIERPHRVRQEESQGPRVRGNLPRWVVGDTDRSRSSRRWVWMSPSSPSTRVRR